VTPGRSIVQWRFRNAIASIYIRPAIHQEFTNFYVTPCSGNMKGEVSIAGIALGNNPLIKM
jgi:hypothetical protein